MTAETIPPLADAPDPWVVPDDDEQRARFRVVNDRMAAWAMRKTRDAARRREEIRAIAEAEITRIEEWATAQDAGPARDGAYFEALLAEYALTVRAADPRRKTVTTPYGEVRTRTAGGAWEVDQGAVLEWAREHRPELVRTTEAFAVTEAKKKLTVTDDGEVVDPVTGAFVPGVKVAAGRVTAQVVVTVTADDAATEVAP